MPARTYAFPRSHRLSGRLAFAAVYAAAVKQTCGPLVVFSIPNELPASRWGLSVSRRVGAAPARNRIKRLLRESIRLLQHDFPKAYDVVIVVRPHAPLLLAEYQRTLSSLMVKSHAHWSGRPRTMD